MIRLLNGFYRILLYLGALCMITTLLSIVLGVVERQFDFEIPGLDAYAGYSIAGALFLALPEALRKGDHIRVTLILNRLTGRARQIADYWCLGAAAAASTYLAWFALRLVWVSYLTHDVSQASDASPLWIPQIPMALGCIGLSVAFIEDLVRKIVARERAVPASDELAHIE